MKISVNRVVYETVCRRVTWDLDLDIDPAVLEQIESGEHEQYESLDDWVEDQVPEWYAEDYDCEDNTTDVDYPVYQFEYDLEESAE